MAAEAAALVHRGLGGVELFDHPVTALSGLRPELDRLAAEGYRRLSFHAPMPRPDYFREPGIACYFLSEDAAARALSLRVLEDSLAFAATWGAAYVVTHLTYGPADTTDPDRAGALARRACADIAALSRGYGVPVDIEFAAYSDGFNEPARFAEAVGTHPELGLCIDTGHAWIGACRRGRDYLGDIRRLAPLARSMHLWNSRGPGETAGHVPLHPDQSPADGWIDIPATLETVLAANPSVHIIFEYPVSHVDERIRAGFDWIAALVHWHDTTQPSPAEYGI